MYDALDSCASALTIRGEGDALVLVTHARNIATILPGEGGQVCELMRAWRSDVTSAACAWRVYYMPCVSALMARAVCWRALASADSSDGSYGVA